VDPEFTPKGSHNEPDKLRADIQERINRADHSPDFSYDAVLLGFGLCGNSAAGLKAGRLPLVIPRAHDCCTVFMGSKQRFLDAFSYSLSQSWSSEGYLERGGSSLKGSGSAADITWYNQEYRELKEKYGEENAAFIWETLHPKTHTEHIFITTPELACLGHFEKYRETVEADPPEEIRLIRGDMRLLRMLTETDWLARDAQGRRPHGEEFLVVEPGQQIRAVYDLEQVMQAAGQEGGNPK
jgi:hypothetical protein